MLTQENPSKLSRPMIRALSVVDPWVGSPLINQNDMSITKVWVLKKKNRDKIDPDWHRKKLELTYNSDLLVKNSLIFFFVLILLKKLILNERKYNYFINNNFCADN